MDEKPADNPSREDCGELRQLRYPCIVTDIVSTDTSLSLRILDPIHIKNLRNTRTYLRECSLCKKGRSLLVGTRHGKRIFFLCGLCGRNRVEPASWSIERQLQTVCLAPTNYRICRGDMIAILAERHEILLFRSGHPMKDFKVLRLYSPLPTDFEWSLFKGPYD